MSNKSQLDYIIEIHGDVRALRERHEASEKANESRFTDLEENQKAIKRDIAYFKKIKHKALGAVFVISLVGGLFIDELKHFIWGIFKS